MDAERIEPCPYPECGGEADLLLSLGDYWVVCRWCRATGSHVAGVPSAAISAWNRVARAVEAQKGKESPDAD